MRLDKASRLRVSRIAYTHKTRTKDVEFCAVLSGRRDIAQDETGIFDVSVSLCAVWSIYFYVYSMLAESTELK